MEFRIFVLIRELMIKEKILNITNTLKNATLTDWQSHKKLAPKLRLQYDENSIANKNPRDAAVLILLYPNLKNEISILLTKRANYNGTHAAQISFPGGKKENSDKNLQQTALREAQEETGIIPSKLQFIKQLSKTYIPPSNFMVHPFVFATYETPDFKLNYEVERIIAFPITELLDNKNVQSEILSTSYMKNANVPCFKYKNEIIWGATAMILSELKDLITF